MGKADLRSVEKVVFLHSRLHSDTTLKTLGNHQSLNLIILNLMLRMIKSHLGNMTVPMEVMQKKGFSYICLKTCNVHKEIISIHI